MNKIKTRLILLFVMSIVFISGNIAYCDSSKLQINMNSKSVVMDVAPQLKNSVTYVPISFIAKELGATVDWKNPTVVITKDGIKMTSTLGSDTYTRGIEQFTVKEVPFLYNNRVFVPLRIISEQFGCEVNYNATKKEININSRTNDVTPKPLPQNDDSEYRPSPDTKWSVREKEYYNENSEIQCAVYLKNTETNEIKEIYNRPGEKGYTEWMPEGRLLLRGTKDIFGGPDRNLIMIYDCNTGNIENIFENKHAFYVISLDSFVYHDPVTPRSDGSIRKEDFKNIHIMNLKTKEINPITYEEYEKYLQQSYLDYIEMFGDEEEIAFPQA